MREEKRVVYIADDSSMFFLKRDCQEHDARMKLFEALARIDTTGFYPDIVSCYEGDPKNKSNFNKAVVEAIMLSPRSFAQALDHYYPRVI